MVYFQDGSATHAKKLISLFKSTLTLFDYFYTLIVSGITIYGFFVNKAQFWGCGLALLTVILLRLFRVVRLLRKALRPYCAAESKVK